MFIVKYHFLLFKNYFLSPSYFFNVIKDYKYKIPYVDIKMGNQYFHNTHSLILLYIYILINPFFALSKYCLTSLRFEIVTFLLCLHMLSAECRHYLPLTYTFATTPRTVLIVRIYYSFYFTRTLSYLYSSSTL